jgi:hypothetical protein
VLAATKAIPLPIPLDKIQGAVDPTYLQKYMKSHPN